MIFTRNLITVTVLRALIDAPTAVPSTDTQPDSFLAQTDPAIVSLKQRREELQRLRAAGDPWRYDLGTPSQSKL